MLFDDENRFPLPRPTMGIVDIIAQRFLQEEKLILKNRNKIPFIRLINTLPLYFFSEEGRLRCKTPTTRENKNKEKDNEIENPVHDALH